MQGHAARIPRGAGAPGWARATGGGARMYRISSPSLEKSGDGMAMAWRAGAAFVDMEMLQFHPTGLLVGNSMATGGLLEEGLRRPVQWRREVIQRGQREHYDPHYQALSHAAA